jgi:hypothetical protein
MLQRILNAIQSLPTRKRIDPDTHAALDYLTISAFLISSGLLWNRNRRAAIAALLNGGFVLSYSLFTDYSSSLRPLIPFETHGKLDIIQASAAALAPNLMGFSDSGAAALFRGQAINEAMVVSQTDWYAHRQRDLRQVA